MLHAWNITRYLINQSFFISDFFILSSQTGRSIQTLLFLDFSHIERVHLFSDDILIVCFSTNPNFFNSSKFTCFITRMYHPPQHHMITQRSYTFRSFTLDINYTTSPPRKWGSSTNKQALTIISIIGRISREKKKKKSGWKRRESSF